MTKRLIYVAGLLLAAALVFRVVTLIGKGSDDSQRGFRQPPIAVEVDSVRYGPIREIREFTGSIYPYYQYVIAPKVSGRILEIRKRIGDSVAAREMIARIDDAEYQQAVREAEASLKIAQASLAEAQSQFALAGQELVRVRSLEEKGIASASELDAGATNYEAQQSRLQLAQAQVEQREAALRSARIRLDYTVLKATEPGFVGERFVDEGSLLAPNAPVLSILGMDSVIVRTTIIERDYGRIQIGQSAEVEVDAFPDERFGGRVARIAPMLQQASRMAEMEIEVANESLLLKPGMFTRVRVVLDAREMAQLVPTHAIVDREGQRGVLLVDLEKQIARFVPVEVGIVTPERAEIVSPEISGLLVTLGQHLLVDGGAVILPPGTPGAGSGQSPGGHSGADPAGGTAGGSQAAAPKGASTERGAMERRP